MKNSMFRTTCSSAEGYDGTATVDSVPAFLEMLFLQDNANTVQVGESRGDEEGEEEPTPVCTVPEQPQLI